MASKFANPSSLHASGRKTRALVEESREKLAEFINAHPSQIVFTSGGTEANNLALKGCIEGMRLRHTAYSSVEHPSVRDVARYLSRTASVTELNVDSNGKLDMSELTEYCQVQTSPALISVMLANNETGVLQNMAEISRIARSHGHFVHSDAVQALGKVDVDFKALQVNLLSLSAHKLNGPKGVGALVLDKALELKPLLHGGGQERGLRSGTENIAAIVGFAKAAEIAQKTLEEKTQAVKALRDYLESELRKIPGVVIFAENAPRLPNTTFFGFPGIDGETLLMQFDSNDIAVTSGSACSSKSGKPSHVLLAMNINEQLARSAVRVSLGMQNTKEEVDKFVNVLGQQCQMISRLNAFV